MQKKSGKEQIAAYLTDAANFSGSCEEVYFPETADEASGLIAWLSAKGTRFTISGARTGLTGGSAPEGGVLISTEKLNRIISLNAEKKAVVTEPGVALAELQEKIIRTGLYYPPDPTEQNCYIGGTVATNASGAKSFKYGPTRNYINALEIILADGDRLSLRRGEVTARGYDLSLTTFRGRNISLRLPDYKMPGTKNAAGYFVKPGMDAVDLFIGSEGTLGFISRIELRLLDKPEGVLSGVIFFEVADSGLSFIEDARESGTLNPLGLEFFDKRSLRFLRDRYPSIPDKAEAAVWFEQEITSADEESATSSWLELIEDHKGDAENSWLAADEKDRRNFHTFRHDVSAKVNDYISAKGLQKVGTDIAVPHQNFRELYAYSEQTAAKSGIDYLAYGHFGDSHLHLNLLPKDKNEYRKARGIYTELCKKAVSLKGTISAEHGIGKLKRDYLEMMYGADAVKEMARIKSVFDPAWLLNPGNLFKESYKKL